MTKTEYLKQGVDILRADLLTIFQDPDDELVEMSKTGLKEFAKDNWDVIEAALASREDTAPDDDPVEEDAPLDPDSEPTTEPSEDSPLDPDPGSSEEESPATTESDEEDENWEGNPKTNLHTGSPGNEKMRAGTRNLA